MAPERLTTAAWREWILNDCACLARSPRAALRFVTIVIDIRIIDDPALIPPEVCAVSRAFAGRLRARLRATGKIKRATRWAGALEFDLLHPRLLGGSRKQKLAAGMNADLSALRATSRVLVTHAHFVIDTRGHASAGSVMDAFRAEWPGAYRVLGKPLHTDKSVRVNLDILGGYMSKLKTRYSQAWLGDRTEYGPDYEPVWQRFVTNLQDAIGFADMRVSSVKSRAGSGSKCPFDVQKVAGIIGQSLRNSPAAVDGCKTNRNRNRDRDTEADGDTDGDTEADGDTDEDTETDGDTDGDTYGDSPIRRQRHTQTVGKTWSTIG